MFCVAGKIKLDLGWVGEGLLLNHTLNTLPFVDNYKKVSIHAVGLHHVCHKGGDITDSMNQQKVLNRM